MRADATIEFHLEEDSKRMALRDWTKLALAIGIFSYAECSLFWNANVESAPAFRILRNSARQKRDEDVPAFQDGGFDTEGNKALSANPSYHRRGLCVLRKYLIIR
jgi:hypothetical protein